MLIILNIFFLLCFILWPPEFYWCWFLWFNLPTRKKKQQIFLLSFETFIIPGFVCLLTRLFYNILSSGFLWPSFFFYITNTFFSRTLLYIVCKYNHDICVIERQTFEYFVFCEIIICILFVFIWNLALCNTQIHTPRKSKDLKYSKQFNNKYWVFIHWRMPNVHLDLVVEKKCL